MEIQEILDSLKKGKISDSTAKKMLSLYSIEKIEGIENIDINRRKRRGTSFEYRKIALSQDYYHV